MILDGPKIKDQSEGEHTQSCASIAISQLIVFNSLKSSGTDAFRRHSKDRETPLPIYLALKVHGETRKRTLIDTLYDNGLCISYDRLLSISTGVANSICAKYEEDGIVCPPKLSDHLFTTAAVDNIDHNPSSTTSMDSFHGTSISIMQHPKLGFEGAPRFNPVIDERLIAGKKITALPDRYTNVSPTIIAQKEQIVPPIVGPAVRSEVPEIDPLIVKEYEWLNNLKHLLDKHELDIEDHISWGAYHASKQMPFNNMKTTVTFMPLFLDCAHSIAMIKHSMNVISDTI
ncbi:hypothetical protein DPMN_088577 [Dreissena polymorpha]|uniref:Uncharacterized protein n=1 Tax=Dreissena polymorpha TaxID=45954 RepID=A0A9D4KUC7_DREPO|nr:hypothetical protein DPMN_088577 [Dreissena polymorpha]